MNPLASRRGKRHSKLPIFGALALRVELLEDKIGAAASGGGIGQLIFVRTFRLLRGSSSQHQRIVTVPSRA
jgi:hypothetical protein